ncbi:MAG: sulfatase [marine bacterium B5-7]|nr:MAG: sulfatase [marine bacterium B5-7]
MNGTPLDARHTNIALEARKAGYAPALFGYTDVSLDPRSQDISDGYEGVLPGMDPVCKLLSDGAPWLARLMDKGYDVSNGVNGVMSPQKDYPGAENRGKTFAAPVYSAEDSNTAFLVDEAMRFISEQKSAPWFAHLSFVSPHPPFIVPEPYNSMYEETRMPLPVRCATLEEEIAQHPWHKHFVTNPGGAPLTEGSKSSDNIRLNDQSLRQVKATYYGMISEVDDQIGRLIDYLKETGAYKDTMIVFTSDHGENLGDHWAFAKYTYFDQTFHVPLIIRDPAAEADSSRETIVEAFTESVDIMPTILDRISLAVPDQCDGRSLLPFCRGEVPELWREEAHMEFDIRAPYDGESPLPCGLRMNQCIATIIRGERYKYIHFVALPPLLFDMQEDPNEFNNLANDPAYQAIAHDYVGKLLSWRVEHDATALTDFHLTEEKALEQGLRSR